MSCCHFKHAAIAGWLIVATAGCPDVDPQTACEDLADAQADLAASCGVNREGYLRGYLESAAGGSCENITEINDIDDLYQRCIPKIDDLTCEQFEANVFPSECANQLGR